MTSVNSSLDRALPTGSLILVTGASGFIASHIVKEALLAGYKVRGTARSEEKAAATAKTQGNHPDYSTVVVADFQHDGVFDEAVKGVHAVIHVASDTTFNHDPNVVIPSVKSGVKSILKSAAASPSVKRFVLTSSSVAACYPSYDKPVTVNTNTWNDLALEQAWAPPPYTEERSFFVYSASKVEGERALWEFMREQKPQFVANAVLPNFNMGKVLSSGGPTGRAIPDLFRGSIPSIPSQYTIDVIDDARIHLIAAVLDPSLSNERIFAFNEVFTWTEMIKMLHTLRPKATTIAQPPQDEKPDLTKIPIEVGAGLLKKWYGQEGYTPLIETVTANLEGIE